MKPFEKLQKRLKDEYGIEVTGLHRTYAGKWQKSAGEFVWEGTTGGIKIGSCERVSDCISPENELEFLMNSHKTEMEVCTERRKK